MQGVVSGERQLPQFGRRLRELRLAAGFSQAFLAEKALLSEDAIGALERGNRRAPQRETLARLARALELPSDLQEEFEALAEQGRARANRETEPDVAHRSTVPVPASRFFGRESEIEALVAFVTSGSRIVTIVGTGGSGKTRLAIETARTLEPYFASDVRFVDLLTESRATATSGDDTTDVVARRIAEALGVVENAEQPIFETLRFALVDRRIMMVIDNCEHLIDDCAIVVNSLVQSFPKLFVLMTSREPLRIGGENVFRPAPLAASAAAELFIDRAASYVRTRTPEIDEIVRHLDGNPLAIELAAPRLDVLSVEQLARALDDRFRILARGMRDAPARHRTLRAMVDWSYDPLSNDQQFLLQLVSAFSGGWTVEAVTACLAYCEPAIDAVDGLNDLADKSLIVVDSGVENRYSMLETIHRYALDKRLAGGNDERICAAHARTFADLAADWETKRRTMEEGRWFALPSREIANYRSALSWSLSEMHDPITGARLATSLRSAFRHISPAEGQRWARAARAVLPADAPSEVRADLLVCLGGSGVQKSESTISAYEEAIEIYRAIGQQYKAAETLGFLSLLYERVLRFDESSAAIRAAVAYARTAGNVSLLAWLLLSQGSSEVSHPDKEAILAESRALNPPFDGTRAFMHHAAAMECARNSDFAGGRALLYRALDLYGRWPNVYRDNRSLALIEVGWQSLALGDLPEARRAARAGLRLSIEAGASEATIGAIRCLGVAAAYAGDAERSLRLMTFAKAESWVAEFDSESDIPVIQAAYTRIAERLEPLARMQIIDDAKHLTREAAIEDALNV